MRARATSAAALIASLPALVGHAQPAQPPLPAVHAGTTVEIVITDELSSATAHRGDSFRLRLAAPIMLNGKEVVAADPKGDGGGEVLAASSGHGRHKAKLTLTARYLQIGGMRAPLQGLTLHGRIVRRGQIVIPAGTTAETQLAADIPAPLPTPPPPPPPPG